MLQTPHESLFEFDGGGSYRRQGRFLLKDGAEIIGRFANASEAPAAALYDAESQPRPPLCS
jgi:hypothetical protein